VQQIAVQLIIILVHRVQEGMAAAAAPGEKVVDFLVEIMQWQGLQEEVQHRWELIMV
jgi:hypothetical protein